MTWRGTVNQFVDLEGFRHHVGGLSFTHKECPGKHMVKADLVAAVVAEIAKDHQGEHLPAKVA